MMEEWKETDIGTVPNEWRIERLKDACKVITDYVANGSFKSLRENVEYKTEEDFAILLRLTDYRKGFRNKLIYINEHAYNFLSKSKLEVGDIIVSNVGAKLGSVFRAPDLKKPMSLGPNAILIRAKENDDFLYYWLLSPKEAVPQLPNNQ